MTGYDDTKKMLNTIRKLNESKTSMNVLREQQEVTQQTQEPEQTQTQNTFSSITTTKDVEQWLGNLPESTFKSNLLVVFGAEYGGDSEELNKLLNAFIEIRIQELTNEKKI